MFKGAINIKRKLGLTEKILLGIVLGAVAGLLVKNISSEWIKNTFFIDGIFKILGTGFVTAIKMMVVPLVLVSLICGASAIGDIKKLGRVGGKTILFYVTTTCIAISISIGLAKFINPGVGLDLSSVVTKEPTIGQSKSISELIIGIIPSNPIESMVKGDMLQIIVFAVLIGVAIALIGERAKPFKLVIESLNEICMKMVSIIMNFAPFGVFALMATTGFDAMIPLIKYMISILLALLIHGFIIYGGLFKIFTGLKIKPFLKKFINTASVTFSTASSNAALPVTLKTMDDLGVDKSISSFTIPLGATINMDGTAIMQGTAAIFIAQVYGVELGISGILTIILTATLASIGTAGVPGVGMVMLSMVLQSVGLPIEGIALILGVDRILDMCRTTVNTMGDCICTLIISKSEKAFDEEIYYRENNQLVKGIVEEELC
ncbi:MAG: dicarboxylate/amino acid:cation symporter [Sarcina sp.]